MAKNYPVRYTILVWLGVVAFGFVTFYGIYILSFLPEIPTSEAADRQVVIQAGAANRGDRRYKPYLSRHVAVAQPSRVFPDPAKIALNARASAAADTFAANACMGPY